MATQFDPIAKDESLNTTETPSRNIADVLAQGLAAVVGAMPATELANLSDVIISTPSNGQTLKYNSVTQKWENANDAGGHTIENPSGTDMTQRANLQFVDAGVSDDSVNDRTKVEVVTELLNETAFDNLATDGTADGAYVFPDSGEEYLTADNVGYGSGTVKDKLDALGGQLLASVTSDGVKNNGALLNELYSLVTLSEVTPRSILMRDTTAYTLSNKTATALTYSNFIVYGSFAHVNTLHVLANNSGFYRDTLPAGTIDDYSASVPSAGLVYAIYA